MDDERTLKIMRDAAENAADKLNMPQLGADVLFRGLCAARALGRKRKTVFDVDDVMWPLNEHVAWAAGVDFSKIVTFYSHDNPILSQEEKNRLYNAYQLPFVHSHMDFYPDARLIAYIARDPRFDAWICSNSVNQQSVDDKTKNLTRLFMSDYDLFTVQMNLIAMADSRRKKMPEDIWCLVDDNPINAIESNAEHVLMPRKPWNQSEWGLKMLGPIMKKVLFFNTIAECVMMILELYNQDAARDAGLEIKPEAYWTSQEENGDYLWSRCSACGFKIEALKCVETGTSSNDYKSVIYHHCPICGRTMGLMGIKQKRSRILHGGV